MTTPLACRLIDLQEALRGFVQTAPDGHQGARHIKPIHWYVACRLVVEGGFDPDDIVPRPPFRVEEQGNRRLLCHVPQLGNAGELTVLGGLKTKVIDVVVTRNRIGPVLALSVKGTLNAFRNLTNRMEEAVGDCTNLHLAYPALVYGFIHVLRANAEGEVPAAARQYMLRDQHARMLPRPDIAIHANGEVSEDIRRYHEALSRLAGRSDLRDPTTRYESIALLMANPTGDERGFINNSYPPADSPLLFHTFFDRLYREYDSRFVFAAPALARDTRRREWAADSPALRDRRVAALNPRVAPA